MSNLKIRDGFKGERSIIMPEIILRMAKADPVLSTLHITDIGYYPHATHHYRERKVPIDQCVLIYCVNGSGTYRVADRQYEVHANQFFVLPQMTPHAYASNDNDPWTIYWIHFRGSLAQYYAEGLEKPTDVSPNINSRIADRNDIFEDMFLTLNDGYTIDNLRYTSSLLHFYLGSMRYMPIYRKNHKKHNSENTEADTIISEAMRYMEENIGRQISLQELAHYTGYSVSHFSAAFKNSTGHSPLSYFNIMKVKKACELLDTTDMKINQISCMVGIDDAYYFSRLFTKTIGISPKKYREVEKFKI